MPDSSNLLFWSSAAVLFAAAAAWLKMGRGRLLRRLNGRGSLEPGQMEKASRLLLIALALTAAAAIWAVRQWIFS